MPVRTTADCLVKPPVLPAHSGPPHRFSESIRSPLSSGTTLRSPAAATAHAQTVQLKTRDKNRQNAADAQKVASCLHCLQIPPSPDHSTFTAVGANHVRSKIGPRISARAAASQNPRDTMPNRFE